MSDETPDVLCQPDGDKSCGACCGMYNHADHGEEATLERIRRRTLAFHRETDIEDEASLKAFRRRWEDGADVKMLEQLPSCPFLGFVDLDPEAQDPGGGRVGCLAHPLQNGGVDGRDCGVYDRFICEEYLCAAHDVLDDDQVRLVLDAVDDSYLYGLLVTNPKFVRHLLEIVARRVGARATERELTDPDVVEAAGGCFELMREWPHRDGEGIFGQVQVDQQLNMRRRTTPADRHDIEPQPVDGLLVCLGTRCDSVRQLRRARETVDARVRRLVGAVRRARP